MIILRRAGLALSLVLPFAARLRGRGRARPDAGANPAATNAGRVQHRRSRDHRGIHQDKLFAASKDLPGVDRGLNAHKQFGGFDLLEINDARAHQFQGWVRAHDSDAVMELAVETEPAKPHRITTCTPTGAIRPRSFIPRRLTEAAPWRPGARKRRGARPPTNSPAPC